MTLQKISSFKSLLESSEGVHLTAYLENRADLIQLKKQLREILITAQEYLHPVMKQDEEARFLEPIRALLEDTRLLKEMRGNIGIFRTQDAFRILNLPIEVENTCVVATSFHVKPLLRWMQMDREFLLVGLGRDSAVLYHGNQTSFKYLDEAVYPEAIVKANSEASYQDLKDKRKRKKVLDETMEWLSQWIEELTAKYKPILFLAGDKEMVSGLVGHLNYENLYPETVSSKFNESNVPELCAAVRLILRKEARTQLELALLEFHEANNLNIASKNIFQIARAAVQGKVKKLMITDGIKIFGKLNKRTGGLAIHPAHLDHEDDCLLDDLAQEVLAHGGEVIVVKNEDIPKGRPILAIVGKECENLAQTVHVGQQLTSDLSIPA